jgi:hypothetical protein
MITPVSALNSTGRGHQEDDRCEEGDQTGVRCQLLKGHVAPHAAAISGTYPTWQPGEVRHWRLFPAPHWLIELSWAPGFQPSVQ